MELVSISKGRANAVKSQTHGAELGWISEIIVSDFHSVASSVTVLHNCYHISITTNTSTVLLSASL